MGFSVAWFIETPDEEWICAICRDVFEDPVCTPCGHSFCTACLDRSLANDDRCPTCRTEGLILDESLGRNCGLERAVQKFILKSTVRCSNKAQSEFEPSSVRRRLNNGKVSTEPRACSWTGKLDDWKKHCHDECIFHVMPCSVQGCDHTCIRRDMPNHMVDSIAKHMGLMVDAKTKALAKKLTPWNWLTKSAANEV